MLDSFRFLLMLAFIIGSAARDSEGNTKLPDAAKELRLGTILSLQSKPRPGNPPPHAVSAVQAKKKIRVEKLEIDRSELFLPCRPGFAGPASGSCNDSFLVHASATISGAKLADVRFNTTVSGGQVVASDGPKFTWDLTSMRPGTYTLSVSAIDREKKRKWSEPKTVEVTIIECRSCGAPEYCPGPKIIAPRGLVAAGETVIVTAQVGEYLREGTTYNWTVSAGSILTGQGTSEIRVATDSSMAGSTIEASVAVMNPGWNMSCITTATGNVRLKE